MKRCWNQILLSFFVLFHGMVTTAKAAEIQTMARPKKPQIRRTALHDAVEKGNLDTVRRLLSSNYGTPAKSTRPEPTLLRTPLHLAAIGGNTKIIEELLGRNQEECLVYDRYGKTPALYALHRIQWKNFGLLPFKLIHGSPQYPGPVIDQKNGIYALHYATQQQLTGVITWLLKRRNKQNVNVTDNMGRTALFHASKEDTVSLLFEHGIDPDLRDKQGKSAYEFFQLLGKKSIAERIQCETERRARLQQVAGPLVDVALLSQQKQNQLWRKLIQDEREKFAQQAKNKKMRPTPDDTAGQREFFCTVCQEPDNEENGVTGYECAHKLHTECLKAMRGHEYARCSVCDSKSIDAAAEKEHKPNAAEQAQIEDDERIAVMLATQFAQEDEATEQETV